MQATLVMQITPYFVWWLLLSIELCIYIHHIYIYIYIIMSTYFNVSEMSIPTPPTSN